LTRLEGIPSKGSGEGSALIDVLIAPGTNRLLARRRKEFTLVTGRAEPDGIPTGSGDEFPFPGLHPLGGNGSKRDGVNLFQPFSVPSTSVIVFFVSAIDLEHVSHDSAKGDDVAFERLWFEISLVLQLSQN
jgi:hypothetical protein